MKMEVVAEVKKRVQPGDDAEFKAGFSPVHPYDMLYNLWNVSCVLPAKIILLCSAAASDDLLTKKI